MGIVDYLSRLFRKKGKDTLTWEDVQCCNFASEIYIRELAFWSCVNLIASAISRCEFKTFRNGEEIKEREYYLWNYSPNRNQGSSTFIHKWIAKLYRSNESLLISNKNGDQLFVADSFMVSPNTMLGDTFNHVAVDQYDFPYSFRREEVLFYRLFSQDMRLVLRGIYESYAKLITAGMQNYEQQRGGKALFKYDTLPAAGTAQEKAFNEIQSNRLKTFMSNTNAVLPLGKGWDLEEYGKRYATGIESSRDIREMIDDLSDFTARALQIPPALVSGKVQDTKSAVERFLTFCIDPLADLLAEEINRQRYGYAGFRRGNKLVIDTRTISHVDILNLAPNIDKLISSGCFSVNDILEKVGENRIDEPWADEHFMTRNYQTIEQALATLGGGSN